MIVDAHNHIGRRKGLTFLREDLLAQMDDARIDQTVVFSMSERIDNQYIAQSVKEHPDRLIGFATINPWDDNAEEELEHCIDHLDLQGLKLHPVKHGYVFDDHFLLDPLFDICVRHNIPVLAYGAADVASIPNHFEEMANTYPSIPFIMAHMGYMYETNSAIDVAFRAENVFLEISGVFVRQIQHALRKVGAGKIIFGTDTPKDEFSYSLKKVYMSTSDSNEQELILGRNILGLLGESRHSG